MQAIKYILIFIPVFLFLVVLTFWLKDYVFGFEGKYFVGLGAIFVGITFLITSVLSRVKILDILKKRV